MTLSVRACAVSLFLSVFLAASAGAQAPKPDLSGADPHWIKDDVTQCWAANPDPAPGETITWTGGCENGLLSGPGTLTWYVNGRLFGRDEGEFKNGELFGRGRIVFANGAFYEGNFPGFGEITLPDGSKHPAQSIHEPEGWRIQEARPEDVIPR